MPFPDVTTARLLLSRWEVEAHTPALATLNAQPATVRYLNEGLPYTPAQSAAQSERFSRHWSEHGFGLWAATLLDTGQTIGFVGLSHPLWFGALAHEVEVGWRLPPAFWGNGYATESASAALAAGFEHLGLVRIIAVIDPANTASSAVARRLRMTVEGTL